ncbi:MAG: hypothetical protein L6265_10940 [Thermoplasmatales archaeon]|nr:hypothetical protein [Thermoplasmatales archaeon]
MMQTADTVLLFLLSGIYLSFEPISILLFCLGIIMGLYGIWKKDIRPVAGSAVILIVLPITGNMENHIIILVFSVMFIMYIELAHAITKFHRLKKNVNQNAEITMIGLNEAMKRYIRIFPITAAATTAVTLTILVFTGFLGCFSEKIAESVELNSVYGVVFWVAVFLGGFWLIRTLVHRS